ncbi:MAG: autotransporter domain-containing protein [Proteobacteria bacterium]|nr:autotransporter domain-containing protein [Pseudomonadota bacterium]
MRHKKNERILPESHRFGSVHLGSAGAVAFFAAIVPFGAQAQDSTWLSSPATNAYNTAGNWTAGVPTGTATFDTSNTTNITVNGGQTVGGFTFNSAAPAYNFTMTGSLTFNGDGIQNNTSNTQTIDTNGQTLTFSNSAATTSNTTLNINLSLAFFQDSSSAAFTTIVDSGSLTFSDNAKSLVNTITVTGGGFLLSFADNSTVTNNLITVDSGSLVQFTGSASTSGSNIIANAGGKITFSDLSSASSSIVNASDPTAVIDISGMTTNLSIGTVSGSGSLFLGGTELTVGGRNEDSAFSGVIQDGGDSGGTGGSLVKTGTATLTLSGANTYTGGTTVSGGLVNFSAANNFGTGTVTLNGGGLQWATGTSTDISSRLAPIGTGGATFDTNGNSVTLATGLTGVSGDGGVTKNGSGTLTLTGANTYTGGTTVNAGTVALSGSGSIASSSGLNLAAAGAGFDISGTTSGATIKDLTGVSGSTIALGAKTLTAGTSNDTTFAGVLSGVGGGFTKQGSGTLTLSAAETYTGLTTVSAGTLALTGSLAGAASVAAGATLRSATTIGGSLTVSGTVSTGASIGTLNVGGNYSQLAGSTNIVKVDSTGAGDKIVVNGTASLAGTLSVQAAAGTYQRVATYTIMSATGGITGAYSSVTDSLAGQTASASISGNNLILTLTNGAAILPGSDTGAFNSNQQAVASVINRANPSATGDFATVITALFNLDAGQLGPILQAISGQSYSGMSTIMVQSSQLFMDSFQIQMGGALGGGTKTSYVPLRSDTTDACDAACDVEPLWGAWGGGTGVFGTVAGSATANGLTYNLGGFIGGVDRRFGPNFRAGIAAGFNSANFWTSGAPGNGTSDTFQTALYGKFSDGPLYVDGLAGYGRSDNRMKRPLFIPGLAPRVAQGSALANSFFGQMETGYGFNVAPSINGVVTPFARLQASTSTQDGFTETGADSLNLIVAGQTTQSLRSVLGAQFGAGVDAPWGRKMNVALHFGWSHEFADLTRPVTAAFAGAPALAFTTQGATAPRDGAVLGFGVTTDIAEQTSLYVRYDGDLAGGNTSHAFNGGVRIVW